MDHRLKTVEDQLAELRQGRVDNEGDQDDLAVLQITREKKITIRMHCTDGSIEWKPALRRIVAIVFGPDILAASCAVVQNTLVLTVINLTQ